MKKSAISTAVGLAKPSVAINVVAEPSPTNASDELANNASRRNASIKHTYKHSIMGFTMTMPCAAAAND